MSMLASHFGRPRGLLGRLVGRMMARFNGDFNRWVVEELGKECKDQPARIVELGPGPGVGLEAALRVFPQARVWGVDPSREMLSQSRKRNLGDAESGRLTLLEGSVESLADLVPIDIVMANHVIYFWHQLPAELAQLHGFLRPGGLLAIGLSAEEQHAESRPDKLPQAGARAL